jgi:hypothetical protein
MFMLSPSRERRLLQAVVTLLALVPVLAGIAGVDPKESARKSSKKPVRSSRRAR